MAEEMVIGTVFTFKAVRVLGEVREIQFINHMPHKHEDDGKSGVWCLLRVSVLGGATDPWDSLASQLSIINKTQVLMRAPGSK